MSTALRVPPNNPEAEQSVLGGILLDNQMYARLEDVIEPDDFYRPANAKIFRSMRELALKNEPIDIVTLTVKMKEMGVYEECGGAAYLAEILERVPTAINAEYHAKLVADQAVKRRLVSACTELGQRGMEPGEVTEELLDHAEKTIFGLTSTRKTKSVFHLRDIIKPAFHELEYRFAHRGELTGVPSGFDGLDKQTYGFQKSDLIIVACRPSVGKTSFSLGVARNAATKGKKLPVLFYSLEMSKEQIVTRLLAAEAKVDSTKIRSRPRRSGLAEANPRGRRIDRCPLVHRRHGGALGARNARQGPPLEIAVRGSRAHHRRLLANHGHAEALREPRKSDLRNLTIA